MFGQQQSQGSLFGSAPQSQGSLFGAPQSQSNIFGASSTPAATFGATSTPTATFGAPAASSQSLFGATPALTPALFGGTPASQSSLFGGSATSQPSMFGGSATAQPSWLGGSAVSQSSLFGATPASQSSLFGGTPASQPSLFGGSAASQPSMFGGGGITFGQSSAGSLFGGAAPQTGFGQPAPVQMKLPSSITDLVEKLNPSHPDSRFRATLYKVGNPDLVTRFQRPADMSDTEYAEAQANNPDPSRLVPVQAKLFDDLLGRAEAQETRVKQNNRILLNIQRAVADIETNVECDVQPRLAALRRRHRQLARRVLRIASKVELAACRNDASGALSVAEIDHKRRLDALSQALTAPGEFKYKLCDLVELSQSSALENKEAFAGDLRDPRAAAAVKTLLSEQLTGIQHLHEVCARMKRDTEIITERVLGNSG